MIFLIFARNLSPVLFGFVVATMTTPCFSQQAAPPTQDSQTEVSKGILDLVRYAPRTQGPLLFVIPCNMTNKGDANFRRDGELQTLPDRHRGDS
ncbi:MAG: hypothetical protein H8F28_13125 [Fibrella sp.]|nr:hypothetical protein [Armatimonadota bacterium]